MYTFIFTLDSVNNDESDCILPVCTYMVKRFFEHVFTK